MSQARSKPLPSSSSHAQGARAAVVAALDPEDPARVIVRLPGEPGSPRASARLAVAALYVPSEGDRVVVSGSRDELYVLGVLHTSSPREATLADGARVRVSPDQVEIADPSGKIVARYSAGAVQIEAAHGDLVLSAPEGKVAVRAGRDVEIAAGRDVTHTAERTLRMRSSSSEHAPEIALHPRSAEVRAPRLDVTAAQADVKLGEGRLLARDLSTTAARLRQNIESLEVTAVQIVETTRDAFREVTDLAETHIGRARTLVRDVFSLTSRRTDMASREDTSIDGRRVLLG